MRNVSGTQKSGLSWNRHDSRTILEEGQSLIEVIVALAVAVLVILALVRVTVTSIRNSGFARNRALATRYAQEAIEKVRAFRDQNSWQFFTASCESIPESPPSPFTLSPPPDCYIPETTNNCSESADSCEVKVTVSWTDAQGTHKSELTTRLTNWK